MRKILLVCMAFLLLPLVLAKTIDIDMQLEADLNNLKQFSVEQTSFDWGVDESKLCTIWTVLSEDTLDQEKECYGDSACCSLTGLASYAPLWDESMSVYQGKMGATLKNTVSARIIYADYSLDPLNNFADIVYSSTANKLADFGAPSVASSQSMSLRVFVGQGNLDVQQLTPANGVFYGPNDNPAFDFFVFHPFGTTLSCDFMIDNTKAGSFVNVSQTQSLTLTHSLTEQKHNYYLSCTDSSGSSKISAQRELIADYTGPVITSNVQDNFTSFLDQITLNFSVTDTLDPQLDCTVKVNDSLEQTITVDSGKKGSVTFAALSAGKYPWYASCTDSAGNSAQMPSRDFFIDMNQAFDLTFSSPDYNIGQTGYYVLYAPYLSDVTVMITKPNGDSLIRTFDNGVFPLVDKIDFNDKPGTYSMDAILIHNGGSQQITRDFNVKKSFRVTIDASETVLRPEEQITLDALPQGGIGSKTYIWDFDDGSTSTSKEVTKTFSKIGDYRVKVTVTDTAGNTAEDDIIIDVKEIHTLEIYVQDEDGKKINKAKVFLEGESFQTNSEGKLTLEVLEGDQQILVMKKGYQSFSEELEVFGDVTRTYILGEDGSVSITDEVEEEEVVIEEDDDGEETPTVDLPPSDFQSRVNSLADKLTIALSSLQGSNLDERDALLALEVEDKMQEAKKNLLRVQRDLLGIDFIRDVDEREQRRQDLVDGVDTIESTVILSLSVLESEEYTAVFEEKEIEMVLNKYVQDDKKQLASALDSQAGLVVLRKVIVIEATMLSGDVEQYTLVMSSFTLDNPSEQTTILESIPKKLAQNMEEVIFLSAHTVLEEDPLIGIDPNKVSEIVYYFTHKVDPEDTKAITTVGYDPTWVSAKSGITGFAVFSSLSNIENPLLVFQITLIVVLLLVYVFYEFEVLTKIRQNDLFTRLNPAHYLGAMANKDMKEIKQLLKQAGDEIENEKLNSAEDTYHKLIKIYNDRLSSELRKKSIDTISAVYNNLLVHRIKNSLAVIDGQLARSEKTKANKSYEKMKELYVQLPKSWKGHVSKQCADVFKRIVDS